MLLQLLSSFEVLFFQVVFGITTPDPNEVDYGGSAKEDLPE